MTPTRKSKLASSAWATGLWQRLTRVNGKDIVDGLAKLAAPGAVVVGGILAHNFQASLTMTQLMAGREDADTKIRAEMFRAITEKLLGANARDTEPERKAVFTELLAVNFHEHFELKPLLRDVDEALRAQIDKETDSERRALLENREHRLLSMARRVRERQVAMLVGRYDGQDTDESTVWKRWRAQDDENARYRRGEIRAIAVHFDGKAPGAPVQDGADVEGSECDVATGEELGQDICVGEPIVENAPDGRGAIAISVSKADWESKNFTLLVKPVPRRRELSRTEQAELEKLARPLSVCGEKVPDSGGKTKGTASGAVEFELTPFDMPLTDNTQLASGSRYSVFIDKVCGKDGKSAKVVKFRLMWFPEDYFPPRERPSNYRELRQALNLTARPID